MSRPPRIEFAGAVHHVTARGDRREEIFRDDRDRSKFLGYLSEGADRYKVKVHCYVLMENHFHLVPDARKIEVPKPIQSDSISKRMRPGHERVEWQTSVSTKPMREFRSDTPAEDPLAAINALANRQARQIVVECPCELNGAWNSERSYLRPVLEADPLGSSRRNPPHRCRHIDHIIPCCMFDLTKPDEQIK